MSRIPLVALLTLTVVLAVACGGGRTETKDTATPAAGAPAAAVATPVQGVTDTEIRIGTHAPLTGPIAGYSVIAKTVKAYFDQINEQGGINGRKITFLIEDDQYSPPKTVEVTRKLVEQDKVFAMMLGLGTGPHTAVVDYIKEKGVIDLFPSTGADKWCQPAQSTVFCFQLPYSVSGKITGQYVAQNYAGKEVGVLYQNDDFGKDSLEAFKAAVGNAACIGPEESYEVTSTNLNAQVLNLKNAGVDVVYSVTLPPFTAGAIKFAKQQGFTPQWIISEVNTDPQTIKLGGAEVMEGVLANGYLKVDEADPAVQAHIAFMQKRLPEVQWGGNSLYAQTAAELAVEILKRAGPNLTRESVIKAAESVRDWRASLSLGPIYLSTTDHMAVEGSRIAQVKNGQWVLIGDYINFESTK